MICECINPKRGRKDPYDEEDDELYGNSDDEHEVMEVDKYQKLKDIRDHPARERRRSSAIPRHLSIAEDQILERVCYETEEEPSVGADVLSRNKRKEFIRRLSVKILQEPGPDDMNTIDENWSENRQTSNLSPETQSNFTPRKSNYGGRMSSRVSKNNFKNADAIREYVDSTIHGTNVALLEGSRTSIAHDMRHSCVPHGHVRTPSNVPCEDYHGQEDYLGGGGPAQSENRGAILAPTSNNLFPEPKSRKHSLKSLKSSNSLRPNDLKSQIFSKHSDSDSDEALADDYEKDNDQAWYIAAKRLEKFRNNSISSCTKPIIQPDTIVDSSNKENWVTLHSSVPKTIGKLPSATATDPTDLHYYANSHGQGNKIDQIPSSDVFDATKSPEKRDTQYTVNEEMYDFGPEREFDTDAGPENFTGTEDFVMYTKQAEGRMESVAISELTNINQTTLTGNSQYPLPGTRIDVQKGGTYTTTRSANNLVSQEEFLFEVDQMRKKMFKEKLKQEKMFLDEGARNFGVHSHQKRKSGNSKHRTSNKAGRVSGTEY